MGDLRCQVPGAGCRVRRQAPGARCATAFIALAFALVATSAHADVREFLGRTLLDVRVEIGGVTFDEPAVLQLVETRVGQPLSMAQVRATIDHLVGLGRFEDIQVFAAAAGPSSDGVALHWVIVPVQRISEIEVTGRPGLDESTLRTEITERLGASPAGSRLPEIIQLLTDYYGTRGYANPAIEPRLLPGRAPGLVTLTLSIDAGPRTVIGNVAIRGDAGQPAEALIPKLRLERGRPYDRVEMEARLLEFEEDLRDTGYYEANVDASTALVDGGSVANLIVDIERGPRVRVVFAGDPLPESRRDALVPIRQERSVDLDLLEDASRNIEAFLRQQGYRAAEAPYVREERSGEMVLTFTVTRGPLHRLSSIDVVGSSVVPLSDIAPLLLLQPGEAFVDSRVATVVAALTELYRVRGFARAVVKAEVTVLPTPSGEPENIRPVAVRLVVSEGAPTTVGDVLIGGLRTIDESRVRPLLGLTAGRPFYRPQLDADRAAIERLYQNEGFRNVRVEARTDLRDEERRLDVHWTVHEGARTIVDHVLVSGNLRTSDALIRREIALQPGGALGDEAVVESQRRLAALGLFRRVRIVELPHGSGENRDVLIEVEEAPSTTISYGGGLEAGRRLRLAEDGVQAEERIEVAPRGFFEVGRRNLWGKNRSVTMLTRVSFRPRDPAVDSVDPADRGGYGFNEYRVVGTFREPRPFDAPGDLQLTAFLEQAIRSSFNFSRRGVRAEYARRVHENVTVAGRYALDRTRLFDEKIQPEDQLLIDRLFPRVRLSTFTGSVLRDSRDDVLDPERGTVLGIDGTLAARSVGSEVGFFKSFIQAFAYRRLPGRAQLTFAAGVRLGFAVGFERLVDRPLPTGGADGQPTVDVVAEVPASERFFAGGDTTVRGFVLDRLGTEETRNAEGFPTGGNGLAVVNLELRTPYWKGLGGVGFFDAGNVFKSAGDVSLGQLRPTAGFGLRYRSPLGPLRVDLGFNLDRQLLAAGARERSTVFHISLGQAF